MREQIQFLKSTLCDFKNIHIKQIKITFSTMLLLKGLLAIALLNCQVTKSQTCNVATFPKVIGGTQGTTAWRQIDYHAATGQLAAVGRDDDTTIKSSGLTGIGTLVMFRGISMAYVWGKLIDFPTVRGLCFSGSGAVVVGHFDINVLFVLNALDGSLIISQTYPASTAYHQFKRNMLLSSDALPIMYLANYFAVSSAGYQIMSFPLEAIQAAPTWALQSVSKTATDISYGMTFGETESVIYNFAAQSGKYLISRINAANGLVIWTQGYTLGLPAYYMMNHLTLSASLNVLFVAAGPSAIQFVRILIDGSGTVLQSDSYTDAAQTGMKIVAIYVTDQITLSALMYGTISTIANQVVLATINIASLQITYQRTLPQLSGFTVGASCLISASKFYMGGYGTSMYASTSSLLNTISTQSQGIIMSSDTTETCQMPYFVSTVTGTLTNAATYSTDQGATVYMNTYATTLTANVITSSMITDLISTMFVPISGWCAYSGGQTWYAQSTYIELQGQASTISIAPVTASNSCGLSTNTLLYSASLYDSIPLPSFMTISSSTGTISISTSNIPGTYHVEVIGTLINSQTASQVLTIVIDSYPVLTTSPADVTLTVGSSQQTIISPYTYTGPYVVSLSAPVITGPSPLPSFIAYDSLTTTLTYSPTLFTQIGTYSINVIVSDPYLASTYTFNLIVINNPPAFVPTTPSIISLNLKQTAALTLPSFSDPDSNTLTLTTYETGQSLLPSFITFTQSSNSYSIAPLTFTDVGRFSIDAKVCDGQPLCATFTFTVDVIDIPPQFIVPALSDQIMMQGDTLNYILPATFDSEGFTVTISAVQSGLSILPDFVSFDGCTFTIMPYNISNVGVYPIQVSLSDGYLTVPYTFNIIVEPLTPPSAFLSAIMNSLQNIGPPVFDQGLQTLHIQVGTTLVYALPQIQDPDNDPFFQIVNLQNSLSFTQYSSSKFTFAPKLADLSENPYSIKIVIKDLNQYFQKQSTYFLQVIVASTPTATSGGLAQIGSFNTSITNTSTNTSVVTKIVTGQMRIIQISKTGEVTVSVLCSNFGYLLVNQLNETMLSVYLRQQPLKLSNQIGFNITSKHPSSQVFTIQLSFNESSQISTHTVSITNSLDLLQSDIGHPRNPSYSQYHSL